MAVPDNYNFNLTDVKSNVTGSPNSLSAAFAAATPIAFDGAYSGAKNSLRNFRNYDEGGGNTLTMADSYLTLNGTAGASIEDVTSNTSWEASVDVGGPWLSVSSSTGTGNGSFGFFRTKNNGPGLRSGTIKLVSTAGSPVITRYLIIDQEEFI